MLCLVIGLQVVTETRMVFETRRKHVCVSQYIVELLYLFL